MQVPWQPSQGQGLRSLARHTPAAGSTLSHDHASACFGTSAAGRPTVAGSQPQQRTVALNPALSSQGPNPPDDQTGVTIQSLGGVQSIAEEARNTESVVSSLPPQAKFMQQGDSTLEKLQATLQLLQEVELETADSTMGHQPPQAAAQQLTAPAQEQAGAADQAAKTEQSPRLNWQEADMERQVPGIDGQPSGDNRRQSGDSGQSFDSHGQQAIHRGQAADANLDMPAQSVVQEAAQQVMSLEKPRTDSDPQHHSHVTQSHPGGQPLCAEGSAPREQASFDLASESSSGQQIQYNIGLPALASFLYCMR